MNRINDGGPAFAAAGVYVDDNMSAREIEASQAGMSLRDFFAAHALAGILSHSELMTACVYAGERDGRPPRDVVTEAAYRYADSMIAARVNPQ